MTLTLPCVEIHHRNGPCGVAKVWYEHLVRTDEVTVFAMCACEITFRRTVPGDHIHFFLETGTALAMLERDRSPNTSPATSLSAAVTARAEGAIVEALKQQEARLWECCDSPLAEAANLITDTAAARAALDVYNRTQREDGVLMYEQAIELTALLTPSERAIASAEWSRQLREKVAASEKAERYQVCVDLQDEP